MPLGLALTDILVGEMFEIKFSPRLLKYNLSETLNIPQTGKIALNGQ